LAELGHDLLLELSNIQHVGKEGNELEAHVAGLVTQAERQLEYHDSALEDLITALQRIPTRVIAEATGYNPRTVRRLKRGEFRTSVVRLETLVGLAMTPSVPCLSNCTARAEEPDSRHYYS
jgi:hypothetical protein